MVVALIGFIIIPQDFILFLEKRIQQASTDLAGYVKGVAADDAQAVSDRFRSESGKLYAELSDAWRGAKDKMSAAVADKLKENFGAWIDDITGNEAKK